MRVTLEQWRMLKAVVDHGGFAQASEVIYKSQSSIHTAVQKLQNSLGVQLLEVQGRKAFVTTEGRILLRRANQMLAEAQKLECLAASFEQGVEPLINIAVDSVFPENLLYPILHELSVEYPQTSIEIYETILGGSNEMLENGTVDIAISTSNMQGAERLNIANVEFITVCAPSHPLAQKQHITYQDLKQYRQVVVRDSSSKRDQEGGWLGADQRWTVDHLKTSRSLLCQGMGYASMPRHFVAELLENNQLIHLDVENQKNGYASVYLVCKDTVLLGPGVYICITNLPPLKVTNCVIESPFK